MGGPLFRIVPQISGKALSLKDGNIAANTQVVQEPDNDNDPDSQLWYFETVEGNDINTLNGGYIKNKKANLCLAIQGSDANGSFVVTVPKEVARLWNYNEMTNNINLADNPNLILTIADRSPDDGKPLI
ncbi:3001_t:CDS:2, partial [Paraglomus occultum]